MAGQGWIATAIRDGHAADRTVEDALQELYMNALDGVAEVVTAPGSAEPAAIVASLGRAITISNPSNNGFDKSVMKIGGRFEDRSVARPKKMGRHSLGLKDALAVLLREGWEVQLTARGQEVRFELRRDNEGDKVIQYHPAAGPADGRWVFTLTDPNGDPEAMSQLVAAVESNFRIPDRSSSSAIAADAQVVAFLHNVPRRKGKPACYRHDGKAGLFIGKRFVELPSSEVTYFGWHITDVPDDIKKMISRDQMIKGIFGLLRELLVDFVERHRDLLDPHLPDDKRCRELRFLIDDHEEPAPAAEPQSPEDLPGVPGVPGGHSVHGEYL